MRPSFEAMELLRSESARQPEQPVPQLPWQIHGESPDLLPLSLLLLIHYADILVIQIKELEVFQLRNYPHDYIALFPDITNLHIAE